MAKIKVPTFAPRKTTSRGGAVVARWAHNPKVAGSSPAPATKKSLVTDTGCKASSFVFVLCGRIVRFPRGDMAKGGRRVRDGLICLLLYDILSGG